MQAARGAAVVPGAGASTPVPVLSRRRSLTLSGAVAGVGVALDQAAKAWAVATLPPGEQRPLFGTLLQWRLVRNSGAAFSLGAGTTWLFSLLAIVALAGLVLLVLPRVRRTAWAVAAGLFGAGIAGNLLDRLFRPPGPLRGHVVDFLELPHWPIFNIADMCITTGAILVVALSTWGRVGHDGHPRGARG